MWPSLYSLPGRMSKITTPFLEAARTADWGTIFTPARLTVSDMTSQALGLVGRFIKRRSGVVHHDQGAALVRGKGPSEETERKICMQLTEPATSRPDIPRPFAEH